MTRVLGSARIFLVTLALSAALSSCAAMASGEPRCDAEVEAGSITGLAAEGESSTIRYCFVVGEDVALINLQIHVRIAEGRVGWVLRDPLGETQESNEWQGWNLASSTRQLQASPGTWQLEVSAEDLIGGYHWSWSAGR
jgi:hypothetical protein